MSTVSSIEEASPMKWRAPNDRVREDRSRPAHGRQRRQRNRLETDHTRFQYGLPQWRAAHLAIADEIDEQDRIAHVQAEPDCGALGSALPAARRRTLVRRHSQQLRSDVCNHLANIEPTSDALIVTVKLER